jgi:alpha-tubulin suppressor-like RCC1 family protein
MSFAQNISSKQFHVSDFMETVGIQPDGTLWISDKPESGQWIPGKLRQYGSETNWQQLELAYSGVVLLKTDGSLWRWGAATNELHQWPGLRAFAPCQIGTNSDWEELFTLGGICARGTDGRVWHLEMDWKTGKDELRRETNFDEIISQSASRLHDQQIAFIKSDGTLWVLNRHWDQKRNLVVGTGVLQVGNENDWRAVAVNYDLMVALKSDGSLWRWNFREGDIVHAVKDSPTRLGIHNDWVAIAGNGGSLIALAGDGSLWLWPDRKFYGYGMLIELPKQPQSLGNIFSKSD